MNQQNPQEKKRVGRRPAVSIDEKIAEAQRNLQQLLERKRQEDRSNMERNRKAIFDLFRIERLDVVDVEVWRKALPKVKALVGVSTSSVSEAAGDERSAVNSEAKQ